MNLDDVFLELLRENIDDIRSGELPKGKFIGKYMQELSKIDREGAFRYKKPQVIDDGDGNNWIDYIINMPEDEFIEFKKAIT